MWTEYASIDEVWGTLAPQIPIIKPFVSETEKPKETVRDLLKREYTTGGVGALEKYLDARMITDIANSVPKPLQKPKSITDTIAASLSVDDISLLVVAILAIVLASHF